MTITGQAEKRRKKWKKRSMILKKASKIIKKKP